MTLPQLSGILITLHHLTFLINPCECSDRTLNSSPANVATFSLPTCPYRVALSVDPAQLAMWNEALWTASCLTLAPLACTTVREWNTVSTMHPASSTASVRLACLAMEGSVQLMMISMECPTLFSPSAVTTHPVQWYVRTYI